ncbi:MAG: iron ABC transporter permease [Chloroflexota bacterium]|nr:iron ABC transporter permease [Chloroflexota bacterium]
MHISFPKSTITFPRRALRLPRVHALTFAAIAITCVSAIPIVYLILRAAGLGAAGIAELLSARTWSVVGNSVVLAGAVVITSVLIGVPFAWLTTRTDLPLRRFWLIAGLLPVVIPSYIGTMALIWVFSPRGALQGLLEPFGVERLPSIYGFFGAWFAITLFSFPYIVLPVRAALLRMDGALEDSARSLGLSARRVFWRVTLPSLRPALGAGIVLTALYTLSDFGAVSLMRYDAFTRVIYSQYTSSFDRERAALLALILIGLTFVLLAVSHRWTRATHTYRAGTGVCRPPRRIRLGAWRIPALIFVALPVGLGVLIPLGVLVSWALSGSARPDLPVAIVNTLSASSVSAFVTVIAALPLGLLAARHHSRLSDWLKRVAYVGYALPGVVIGLAFVFFVANLLPNWYQTLPVLLVGYIVRFLPISASATQSAMSQISPRLEDAARSMGLSRVAVLRRVILPLARDGVLAGLALVFMNIMKELPTTLILSPTGFNTLATSIWTANTNARFVDTGLPSLLLIGFTAISLIWIVRRSEA